jgi:hypothetical protein
MAILNMVSEPIMVVKNDNSDVEEGFVSLICYVLQTVNECMVIIGVKTTSRMIYTLYLVIRRFYFTVV